MLEFLTAPIQVNIWYILLSVFSAVLLIYTSLKNIRLRKKLEKLKLWNDELDKRLEMVHRDIKRKDNHIESTKKNFIESIDKLVEKLEQEQKDHKNTKQYKYRAKRAREERDALKKQNKTLEKEKAELQEFVIFANKVISESDYALKKEYKNSKVKCIWFKKVLENTIKEGHELFR